MEPSAELSERGSVQVAPTATLLRPVLIRESSNNQHSPQTPEQQQEQEEEKET